MSQTVSTSITRRSVVAGLALAAAPVTVLVAADNARAQDKQTVPEKSLYERLGGVFGTPQTIDEAVSDGVADNREDDWHRACCLQQQSYG
jgi:hemoglobin